MGLPPQIEESDCPELYNARRKPLFIEEAVPSPEEIRKAQNLGAERPKGGTYFVVYHKTGVSFLFGLCPLLDGSVCRNHSMNYARVQDDTSWLFKGPVFDHGVLPYGASHVQLWTRPLAGVPPKKCKIVYSPAVLWELPGRERVVHLIRDPVSLIVSAYRFHRNLRDHQNDDEQHEPWIRYPASCHTCDKPTHKAVFELCDITCSYMKLLHSVDEITGLEIEALHSRQSVEHMLGNLRRWMHDPNVLHFSLELLRENFTSATRCLLRFLGYERASLVKALRVLDPNRFRMRHMTHGTYDNVKLRAHLLKHTYWGRQFVDAQAAMLEVHERQAYLYGCPRVARGPQESELKYPDNDGAIRRKRPLFREAIFWRNYLLRMEPHGHGDTPIDDIVQDRLAHLEHVERNLKTQVHPEQAGT